LFLFIQILSCKQTIDFTVGAIMWTVHFRETSVTYFFLTFCTH